jgi:hypothetical protein
VVVGGVTTYRHYTHTIRRAAAPYFELVEQHASAAAVASIPAERATVRDLLNSNFLILVLRKKNETLVAADS